MPPTLFLHCSYFYSIFLVPLLAARLALMRRPISGGPGKRGRRSGQRTGASVEQFAGSGWSAGRRLLKSPPASQPDGTPEGASSDGTRNPVLSGVRLRPGAGLAIQDCPHGDSHSLRRLPALHSPAGRKKGPAVPTPRQITGRRSVGFASLRASERVLSNAWAEEAAMGKNGTLPLCLALLFIREPRMNEHVKRPGRVERDAFGLRLTDAQPLAGIPAVWRLGAIVSTLLMGFLAFIAALYFGRAALLPVAAALVVGITLSPLTEFGTRFKIPPPVSAVTLIVALLAVLGVLITFFAGPVTEWIARAPEIGAAVQQKLRVFEYPLSVLQNIKSAVAPAGASAPTVAVETNTAEVVSTVVLAVTPAIGEFVVFFGTLIFFLSTNIQLRKKLIFSFGSRDGRLRMLRIWNDIESNLAEYLGLVTMINIALGLLTMAMLYLIGFPNPVTFGLLTVGLNYVPYIGPAVMALVLLAVGLVAMPTLAQAALAPALFVAIATLEGHFITPSIVGRRLTLSPFIVFLALVFWTWLWGPVGAFLAVPFLIVSFVVLGHLVPREEMNLPG